MPYTNTTSVCISYQMGPCMPVCWCAGKISCHSQKGTSSGTFLLAEWGFPDSIKDPGAYLTNTSWVVWGPKPS